MNEHEYEIALANENGITAEISEALLTDIEKTASSEGFDINDLTEEELAGLIAATFNAEIGAQADYTDADVEKTAGFVVPSAEEYLAEVEGYDGGQYGGSEKLAAVAEMQKLAEDYGLDIEKVAAVYEQAEADAYAYLEALEDENNIYAEGTELTDEDGEKLAQARAFDLLVDVGLYNEPDREKCASFEDPDVEDFITQRAYEILLEQGWEPDELLAARGDI